MKIHFVSNSSSALGAAYQCQHDGHDVTIYMPQKVNAGKDLVKRTNTVMPKSPVDAVVFEGAHYGRQADELREEGWRVVAGGKWPELMAKRGDYHERVIRECDLQPAGPEDDGDIFWLTDWYERGFRNQPALSFIETRLGTGDTGPFVADQGVASLPLNQHCELAAALLPNLASALEAVKYVGPVSVGAIRSPSGRFKIVGIMPCLGTPLLPSICQSFRGGAAAYLGQDRPWRTNDFGLSIKLTIPPWPYAIAYTTGTAPKFELEKGARRHFWPHDIQGDNPFSYSGDTGILGHATARGVPTPKYLRADGSEEPGRWEQARARALRTARNIHIPGLQYRVDVGEAAVAKFDALEDLL